LQDYTMHSRASAGRVCRNIFPHILCIEVVSGAHEDKTNGRGTRGNMLFRGHKNLEDGTFDNGSLGRAGMVCAASYRTSIMPAFIPT
jgi:hypothetical protein